MARMSRKATADKQHKDGASRSKKEKKDERKLKSEKQKEEKAVKSKLEQSGKRKALKLREPKIEPESPPPSPSEFPTTSNAFANSPKSATSSAVSASRKQGRGGKNNAPSTPAESDVSLTRSVTTPAQSALNSDVSANRKKTKESKKRVFSTPVEPISHPIEAVTTSAVQSQSKTEKESKTKAIPTLSSSSTAPVASAARSDVSQPRKKAIGGKKKKEVWIDPSNGEAFEMPSSDDETESENAQESAENSPVRKPSPGMQEELPSTSNTNKKKRTENMYDYLEKSPVREVSLEVQEDRPSTSTVKPKRSRKTTVEDFIKKSPVRESLPSTSNVVEEKYLGIGLKKNFVDVFNEDHIEGTPIEEDEDQKPFGGDGVEVEKDRKPPANIDQLFNEMLSSGLEKKLFEDYDATLATDFVDDEGADIKFRDTYIPGNLYGSVKRSDQLNTRTNVLVADKIPKREVSVDEYPQNPVLSPPRYFFGKRRRNIPRDPTPVETEEDEEDEEDEEEEEEEDDDGDDNDNEPEDHTQASFQNINSAVLEEDDGKDDYEEPTPLSPTNMRENGKDVSQPEKNQSYTPMFFPSTRKDKRPNLLHLDDHRFENFWRTARYNFRSVDVMALMEKKDENFPLLFQFCFGDQIEDMKKYLRSLAGIEAPPLTEPHQLFRNIAYCFKYDTLPGKWVFAYHDFADITKELPKKMKDLILYVICMKIEYLKAMVAEEGTYEKMNERGARTPNYITLNKNQQDNYYSENPEKKAARDRACRKLFLESRSSSPADVQDMDMLDNCDEPEPPSPTSEVQDFFEGSPREESPDTRETTPNFDDFFKKSPDYEESPRAREESPELYGANMHDRSNSLTMDDYFEKSPTREGWDDHDDFEKKLLEQCSNIKKEFPELTMTTKRERSSSFDVDDYFDKSPVREISENDREIQDILGTSPVRDPSPELQRKNNKPSADRKRTRTSSVEESFQKSIDQKRSPITKRKQPSTELSVDDFFEKSPTRDEDLDSVVYGGSPGETEQEETTRETTPMSQSFSVKSEANKSDAISTDSATKDVAEPLSKQPSSRPTPTSSVSPTHWSLSKQDQEEAQNSSLFWSTVEHLQRSSPTPEEAKIFLQLFQGHIKGLVQEFKNWPNWVFSILGVCHVMMTEGEMDSDDSTGEVMFNVDKSNEKFIAVVDNLKIAAVHFDESYKNFEKFKSLWELNGFPQLVEVMETLTTSILELIPLVEVSAREGSGEPAKKKRKTNLKRIFAWTLRKIGEEFEEKPRELKEEVIVSKHIVDKTTNQLGDEEVLCRMNSIIQWYSSAVNFHKEKLDEVKEEAEEMLIYRQTQFKLHSK